MTEISIKRFTLGCGFMIVFCLMIYSSCAWLMPCPQYDSLSLRSMDGAELAPCTWANPGIHGYIKHLKSPHRHSGIPRFDKVMYYASLQRIRGMWSYVSPTYLHPSSFQDAILRSLITTKIVLKRAQTVLGWVFPPKLRSRLRPRDFTLLCQCLLVINGMFLWHIKATHITDYSAVSGLYGPGAFWAWIVSCIMAFCPNEGLVLLRHIWLDPIVGLENADILDLPLPQDDAEGSEKLYSLRRLLDCIFCIPFPKKGDRSDLVKEIFYDFLRNSDGSLWRNYPEVIPLLPTLSSQLHNEHERATGERAEKILNLYPRIVKAPSKGQSGFIVYHSRDCPYTNGLYHRFFKEVTAEFPWFQMDFEDFHHHLIDLRNRFQFLQYRRELRELAPTLDANTCAAIAYPLIASCVQLTRHYPFQNHHWEAQDEAVASVAQISSTMSVIAILSSRPSFTSITLRHTAWIAVYLCSWTLLCSRAHYVCIEQTFLSYFVTFQVPGFLLILGFNTMWFTPTNLLAWYFPDWVGQLQLPLVPRVQWALIGIMVLFMPVVARADRSKLDPLCAVSSWDIHYSLPIPRSSVSLGELDQVAALATAIFLMISGPLQQVLSSLSLYGIMRVIIDFFRSIGTWSKEKYHNTKRAFRGSNSEMADNDEVELSYRDGAQVEAGRDISITERAN